MIGIGRTGNILLEGTVAILIYSVSIFLLLDLSRLAEMHIAIEQAVFLYVRSRAMGNTILEAEQRSRFFLNSFFGQTFKAPLKFDEWKQGGFWNGRLHVRFPQLILFKVRDHFKHHFEVTKVCRFPG